MRIFTVPMILAVASAFEERPDVWNLRTTTEGWTTEARISTTEEVYTMEIEESDQDNF
jgi:hypothetical protein